MDRSRPYKAAPLTLVVARGESPNNILHSDYSIQNIYIYIYKTLRFAGGYSPPAALAEGSNIERSQCKADRMPMAWRNGRFANAESLVPQGKESRLVCGVVELATFANTMSELAQDIACRAPHVFLLTSVWEGAISLSFGFLFILTRNVQILTYLDFFFRLLIFLVFEISVFFS